MTSALVGIAGAFIGFHIGVMLGLLPSPVMLYVAAAIGALVVLWAWGEVTPVTACAAAPVEGADCVDPAKAEGRE